MKTATPSFFQADLSKYKLSEANTPFIPKELHVLNGSLSGQLTMRTKQNKTLLENLLGSFTVHDCDLSAFNDSLAVNIDKLVANIKGTDVLISPTELVVNEQKVNVSGRIRNISEPKYDIGFHSDEISLQNISGLLQKKVDLTGKVRLDAKVQGTNKDIKITTSVFSDSFQFNNIKFHSLKLNASLDKKAIRIKKCTAGYLNGELQYTGTISRGRNQWQNNGTLLYDIDLLTPFQNFASDSMKYFTATAKAQVSGQLTNPTVFGNCLLRFSSGKTIYTLSPAFSLHDKVFQLFTPDGNSGPLISGAINLADQSEFELNIYQLKDEINTLFDFPFEDYVRDNFSVTIHVSGNIKEFTANLLVRKLEGGFYESDLFRFEASVNHRVSDTRGIGRIFCFPETPNEINGRIFVINKPTVLDIQELTLGDHLEASARFIKGERGERQMQGYAKILNASLQDYFAAMDTLLQGDVNMDVQISGTTHFPDIQGSLSIDNFIYGNVGPYLSEMSFQYNRDDFSLDKFTFSTDSSTILYAQGNYYFQSDSIKCSLKGAGFDAGSFAQLVDSSGPIFDGRTLVDINIEGLVSQPNVTGLIAVKNGHIYNVPFDEIELNIGSNRGSPAEKILSQGVVIQKMRLLRHDKYEISGNGFYPYSRDDSLNISLTGDGNFLQILSDLVPYFENPECEGYLYINITGSPESPILHDVKLGFENGKIEFDSIIPAASDVKAELEFQPDEQFLHLKYLSGKMGGKDFNIYNQLAYSGLSSKAIDNIVLGGSGFNLGVFTLETPQKGVPLNIRGLMEDKVFGTLEALGRNVDEKFYFAFYNGYPTLRGTINLYDCEIMFPFDESAGEPSTIIMDFLFNTEWDIFAYAQKDVRFVRSFPGAIDKAYVNLLVDEKYGGLEFTGRIEDESFRINGEARATSGLIEYLDMTFRLDRAGVEFDRSTLIPVMYGKAHTTITDSTGFSSQVFLTLQTVDNTVDYSSLDEIDKQEQQKGRWDEVRFKLTSDNPNFGTSEAQILASLGYSVENLESTAIDAVGFSTENFLFRPLFRPMERKLEQLFGIDYIRFSSRFTKNFINFNLYENRDLNMRLALLRSTKLILGKYLTDHLFFQYTGQVESNMGYRYGQKDVGLHHTLGLEYRINPQILLELEYDYDSLMLYNRDDKRIVLRHWFPF